MHLKMATQIIFALLVTALVAVVAYPVRPLASLAIVFVGIFVIALTCKRTF